MIRRGLPGVFRAAVAPYSQSRQRADRAVVCLLDLGHALSQTAFPGFAAAVTVFFVRTVGSWPDVWNPGRGRSTDVLAGNPQAGWLWGEGKKAVGPG